MTTVPERGASFATNSSGVIWFESACCDRSRAGRQRSAKDMKHLGVFESETSHNLGNGSRHDKAPLSYSLPPRHLTIGRVTCDTAMCCGGLVAGHHDSSAVG